MKFDCSNCGTETDRPTGHVNRAMKAGNNLYCSKACSAIGRRTGKTVEQKKAEKRAYDMEYRARDPEGRKALKAEYYRRTHDPVREAEIRKKRMPQHVEYCRRPEYREWKRDYDRNYRAVKVYGDFAECFLLVQDIRDECLTRMSDYEIRMENGTLNKSLQRKRDYERSISNRTENGPLGNLERGERGQNGSRSRGCYRLPSPRNSPHHEYATQDLSAGETPCRD